MASSTMMAIVNRCSGLISNLQAKVEEIEAKLGGGGSAVAASASAASSQASVEEHAKLSAKVASIETTIKELSKSLLEARTSLALSKEEAIKDKAMLETTLNFKMEQMINRSIKERIDLAMAELKQKSTSAVDINAINAKIASVESRLLNANPTGDFDAKIASLESRLLNANDIDTKIASVESRLMNAIASMSSVASAPASPEPEEDVASSSQAAMSDFASARKKIIRSARKG
jgi:hypothetical protein